MATEEKICFVSPLLGINIEDDLGSGVRLGTFGWIGNDPALIHKYIGDDWREELGTAVIRKLLGAKAFVFGELPSVSTERRREYFEDLVRMVQQVFLDFLWVVRDNAVNSEICVFGTWDEATHRWLKPVGLSPFATVSKVDGVSFRTLTEFSKKEIEIVAEYMKGVKNINTITHVHPAAFKTQRQKGQEEKIDRFGLGRFIVHRARRAQDITGKIALYCSAFEAMFTTSMSEVSHQLAERVALMLADDIEKRMEVYQTMKEIYEIRSKMMHGKTPKIKGGRSIEEAARQCDDYMRKIVWSLMNAPIPEMQSTDSVLENYFQRRLFGAGDSALLGMLKNKIDEDGLGEAAILLFQVPDQTAKPEREYHSEEGGTSLDSSSHTS